jgi:hypothetical protein
MPLRLSTAKRRWERIPWEYRDFSLFLIAGNIRLTRNLSI